MYYSTPGEDPATSMAWDEGTHSGDIRGSWGYVMAAGCLHPSGETYSVLVDAPIAPVPERARQFKKAIPKGRDELSALQDDLYGLSLRMLCNRDDAEDATQEILIRIVTRLSQFDFRSKLKTWAYRVGVNYILDVKKSPVEKLQIGRAHV